MMPISSSWWYTPILSGAFALIGVLIAQVIVLYLARRTDLRRSDPELLRQCALFSSAAGKFKRQVTIVSPSDWDLSCIDELEVALDSITIIGTPEIELAAERFIGCLPQILDGRFKEYDEYDDLRRKLFAIHREFIDAVRCHFHKSEKQYLAVPMIERPKDRPRKTQSNS